MAQLVVKRGPTAAAATRNENAIHDCDLLHSLWLEKMAANPGFYSDAKGGS
jgi:hypothetical protein